MLAFEVSRTHAMSRPRPPATPPRHRRPAHQPPGEPRPPAPRSRHYTRASGNSCSSANFPFASSVPASGYSPLKHASQWVAGDWPTAS
jgi:hypothetical protein